MNQDNITSALSSGLNERLDNISSDIEVLSDQAANDEHIDKRASIAANFRKSFRNSAKNLIDIVIPSPPYEAKDIQDDTSINLVANKHGGIFNGELLTFKIIFWDMDCHLQFIVRHYTRTVNNIPGET